MILFISKLTVVLLLGGAIAALLRTRSAAARHFVWAVTLFGALLLPLATRVAPVLPVVVPARLEKAQPLIRPSATFSPQAGRRATEPHASLPLSSLPLAPPAGRGWRVAPGEGLYIAGVAAILLWLAFGQLAVFRIARRATPLCDPLIDEARACMGVKRAVRVMLSTEVSAPFTAGWIILLPSEASTWPVERRRAALLHELAHVARNDAPIHLLAGLACALYWPHPAVWLALRRLRRESEQATDDRVIARGMLASEYATQLVDVASAARMRRVAGLAGVAMACPSHLETRLRALLDESRIRGVLSRRIGIAAIAVAAVILVPLAGARPAESTYDRVVEAKSGGTLVLDLESGGAVKITGSDHSGVEVHGELRGRDAAHTVVETTSNDDEVRVSTTFNNHSGLQSTDHEFAIRVPHKFNVRLSSAGGGLTIRDVEGTFEGSTGGGPIHLAHVHGTAHLSTGGGDITVVSSALDGKVSTGGGVVQFEGVTGGLRGDSGDHGEVVVEPARAVEPEEAEPAVEVEPAAGVVTINTGDGRGHGKSVRVLPSGAISITKDGGAVNVERAPHGAVISTGGGKVIVGRAAGSVEVSTGGGMIQVGPVAGSVHASTGAGMVTIDADDAGGEAQEIVVGTGHGPVEISLPADFDGRFEIETSYTESHESVSIHSDWNLQYAPVTNWDSHQGTPRRYVRATGRVGSGRGLVRVRAVNGDVTLRRK